MKASKRLDGAIRFESQREWDAKHPNEAIGYYGADRTIIHEDGTKEVISAEEFEERVQADYESTLKKLGAAAASAVAGGVKADEEAAEATAEEAQAETVEAVEEAETEVVEALEETEAEAVEAVEEAEDAVEEENEESKGGQE